MWFLKMNGKATMDQKDKGQENSETVTIHSHCKILVAGTPMILLEVETEE